MQISKYEWKAFGFSNATEFSKLFQVICQKSYNNLSSKIILSDLLSILNLLRSSFDLVESIVNLDLKKNFALN